MVFPERPARTHPHHHAQVRLNAPTFANRRQSPPFVPSVCCCELTTTTTEELCILYRLYVSSPTDLGFFFFPVRDFSFLRSSGLSLFSIIAGGGIFFFLVSGIFHLHYFIGSGQQGMGNGAESALKGLEGYRDLGMRILDIYDPPKRLHTYFGGLHNKRVRRCSRGSNGIFTRDSMSFQEERRKGEGKDEGRCDTLGDFVLLASAYGCI